MAERRMFAMTIIDSDAFLDMPLSTQSLYFHLGMRADDDGFINSPRKVQRMIGASDDDLKLLIAKNFVIQFESGVVVIKHWKIHNYIRKDRYQETKYIDERNLLITKENGAYTLGLQQCLPVGCQVVDQRLTEDRLGKDRIGKDRLDKKDKGVENRPYFEVNYQHIADMYNDTCVSFPRLTALSDARKKALRARLKVYTLDDFQNVFSKAEASSFLKGANERNWSANFDWMIKDSNMAKILDGNYDDREKRQTNKVAQRLDDFYGMAADWANEGNNS